MLSRIFVHALAAIEGATAALNCASVIPPKVLLGASVSYAFTILSIFSSMSFGPLGMIRVPFSRITLRGGEELSFDVLVRHAECFE